MTIINIWTILIPNNGGKKVAVDKICIVNLTLDTAKTIKDWINEGYSMRDWPTKPVLKYVRLSDHTQKSIKLSKCRKWITKQERFNAIYCYEQFCKSGKDHLYIEVGKLMAITGGSESGREDQSYILRQVFGKQTL